MEATDVGPAHAGIEVLDSWAAAKEASGHKFLPSAGATKGLTAGAITDLLRLGKANHKDVAAACQPKPSLRKLHESIATFFYTDPGLAEAANLEFSRMAAMKREAYGSWSMPETWVPTLTLGSVVVLRDDPERFFACIQPVCDAVRLKKPRRFPFVPLAAADAGERFSLVLRTGPDSDGRFEPDYHPHSLVHESFGADAATWTVCARRAFGRVVFEAESGAYYEWLGDLRGFVAQRLIQRSAGQVDRVGLDEYEWLRLKGVQADD